MVDFGERLKKLRIEKRMTQLQVAEKIGVTKSVVSAYETSSRSPSYDILKKIASNFGVTSDYLLGLDVKRTINTTGLSDSQIEILATLVEEFKRK